MAALLHLLSAVGLHAAEPKRPAPILLPEAAFMHPSTAFAIADSARTVLIPVKINGTQVERISDIQAAELGREALLRATAVVAEELLKSIQPSFHRDPQGVIEYAEMKSTSPATAAVVFAPGLGKRFAETLGPDLLVVIPSRFQVFLFPRHASDVEDFAPMIFEAYDATAFPISPEVFEVTDTGLRAFGVFERP